MTNEAPILPEPTPVDNALELAFTRAESRKKTGSITPESEHEPKARKGKTPRPIPKKTLPPVGEGDEIGRITDEEVIMATKEGEEGVGVEMTEPVGPVRRMGQSKFITRLQKIQRALADFDPQDADRSAAFFSQIEKNILELKDAVGEGRQVALVATDDEKTAFAISLSSQEEVLNELRGAVKDNKKKKLRESPVVKKTGANPNEKDSLQPVPEQRGKVAVQNAKEKSGGVSEKEFVQRGSRIDTKLKELLQNPESAKRNDLDGLEKALIEMKTDIQGKGKQSIDVDEARRSKLEADLDAIYAQLEKIYVAREELHLSKQTAEKRKEILRKKAEKVARDIDSFLELQALDDASFNRKFVDTDPRNKYDTSKIIAEREAVIKNIKLINDPSVNIIIDFDGKPSDNDTEEAQTSRHDAVVSDLEQLIIRLDGMEDKINRQKSENDREEALKRERASLRKPFHGIQGKPFDFEKIDLMGAHDLLNQPGFSDFIAIYDKRNGADISERLEDSANEWIVPELRGIFKLFVLAKETGIKLREFFKKGISKNFDDQIKLPAEAYNSILDYMAELAYNGQFMQIQSLAEHIKTAEELPEQIVKQEEVLTDYLARMGGKEAIQKSNDIHAEKRERLEILKAQSGINDKAKLLKEEFTKGTIKVSFVESDDRLYLYAGGEKTQNKYLEKSIHQYNRDIETNTADEQSITGIMNRLRSLGVAVSEKDMETLRNMKEEGFNITDAEIQTLMLENVSVSASGHPFPNPRGNTTIEDQKTEVLHQIRNRIGRKLFDLRDRRDTLEVSLRQKTASYGESREIVKQLIKDKELSTGSGGDFVKHLFQRIANPRSLMKKTAERMHRVVEKEHKRLQLINTGVASVEEQKEESKRVFTHAYQSIFRAIGPAKDIEDKLKETIKAKIYGQRNEGEQEQDALKNAKSRQKLLDKLAKADKRSAVSTLYQEFADDPGVQASIDAEIQKGIEDKIDGALNNLRAPEPYTQLEKALLPWIQKVGIENEQFGSKQGEGAQRLIIDIIEDKMRKLRQADPRKILVASLLRKLKTTPNATTSAV